MTSESQDLIRKRQEAIAYLRSKGRYILDRGTPPPGWGNAPKQQPESVAHRGEVDVSCPRPLGVWIHMGGA